MSVLKVNGLWVSYAENIILKNINFGITEGQKLAVVGESGSGKTTLLNVCAGLLQQERGEVFINGKALIGPNGKLIAGHNEIKLVAQDFKLNQNFTVTENIAYSLRTFTKEYQTKHINNLLSKFKLTKIANSLPKQCSGGEKQRVAIAKAIADVPKILLLDEPFSNLDNINKAIVKEALAALIKEQKLACLFVTHDLLDAINFADQISIIKNGKIFITLTPSNLIDYKGDKYIENFVKATFDPILNFKKSLKQS